MLNIWVSCVLGGDIPNFVEMVHKFVIYLADYIWQVSSGSLDSSFILSKSFQVFFRQT